MMSALVFGRVRNAALPLALCISASALLLSVRGALGATVSLAWDPAQDAAGYHVYYGAASRQYTNVVDAGSATTVTISNLLPGVTYSFAATTYNLAGLESDYSSEAAYTVPGTNQPPPPPNAPPTLNVIPNVSVNENSGAYTVQLAGISSGSVNETQTLSLSAFSSNTGLVPNPDLVYSSPNTTGTLTFTPAAGSYGTVTMTVMVDDGGAANNTVIRTFQVNVLPFNYPPTLDPIADVVIDENSGPQSIPLTGITTGGDPQSQNLTITAVSSNTRLIPAPAVNYANPNSTGSLVFTPLANSYGSSLVTVTVSDGQPTNSNFSRTFTVTVNQVNSGGTNVSTPGQWTLWWQRKDGVTAKWAMDTTNAVQQVRLNTAPASAGWRMVGMGDFGGATHQDIAWQHTNGWTALWLLDGTNILRQTRVGSAPAGPGWQIGAIVDLDEDGQPDFVWQHTSGVAAAWLMNGTNISAQLRLATPLAGANWRLAAAADFDGDGHADLLWQQPDGYLTVWLMSGTNFNRQVRLNAPAADPGWRVAGTTDLFGSGNADILWQYKTGTLAYWRMDRTNRIGLGRLNPSGVDPTWQVMGPR